MAAVWIGTSGWSYKHWEKGKFYPQKKVAAEYLPFFVTQFATVEINYSYYQLPPRKTFEMWQRKVPRGFLFAVKASRYLTHMKKLKDPAEPLERLLGNASGLGAAFGPVLFQFPRRWDIDLPRLQSFMGALGAYPSHRYAFQFRHQSWHNESVYECLRENNAALCLPIGWGIPLQVELTANWTYIRFHGGGRSHFFEDDELSPWAQRIRAWRDAGVESYSYFNNDTLWQGRPAAIDNARRLREMVGEPFS